MDRVNELLSQYKYALLACLVGVTLIFSGSITSLFGQDLDTPSIPPESIVESKVEIFKVDIAGAVAKPGVYELGKDKRVEDLIAEAGGFTEKVNKEYISKDLNLSQKLSDGQKIYIPFKGETAKPVTMETSTSPQNGKININNASSTQLEELPGVGPSTASKIIAGRPYNSTQDLLTKKILGKATYEKIKDLIEI